MMVNGKNLLKLIIMVTNYIYDMTWDSKVVTLEIYKGREGNVKKSQIEYPNLKYDR